jgi:hypothetical protein
MTRLTAWTPARHRARELFVATLLVLADVGVANGQDTTTARREGWIVGPLLGVPGVGSDYDVGFFTLGVGVTRLVPNRPGLDFAIGTVPRLIPKGVLPIGVRVGPSIPLAVGPDVFIIPSVGLSGVGAVGTEGGGGMGGFYWGAAAVAARGQVGLRVGATWHRPFAADVSGWLLGFGVMHLPLPRRTN